MTAGKKLLAVIAALTITGCSADLDSVMGRSVEGTPTTEPRTVHCDLIFPGGGQSDRR